MLLIPFRKLGEFSQSERMYSLRCVLDLVLISVQADGIIAGVKMKKRIAVLIFFALISLNAGYSHFARGDESGTAVNAQNVVKDVDAREARVIIENKKGSSDLVILDVRTDEEFTAGHIDGAENIDVNSESFKNDIGKLDKSKTYIVHCRTGRRSETAVNIMEEMGFTDIYWMQDGIVGWQDDGYPVVK